jgi:DNA alkylation repair enzyme
LDLAKVIRSELQKLTDAQRAVSMQAYMKSAMPMLGVARPQQIVLFNRVFAAQPLTTARTWQAMCTKIWRGSQYREERYAAIDLTGFRPYRKFQTLDTPPCTKR